MIFLFRVDSGAVHGGGHLARCLALASSLRKNGEVCRFLTRPHTAHRIHVLQRQGFDVHQLSPPSGPHLESSNWLGTSVDDDVQETLSAIQAFGPVDWLVVDHYAIDLDWHQALRSQVGRLLIIDDLGDRNYLCDLLLNQVYGATEGTYRGRTPEACRLLLGPRFALLRGEFQEHHSHTSGPRRLSLEHAFVCFGAHDGTNETLKALQALEAYKPTRRATVVVGNGHPDLEKLQSWRSPALAVNLVVESDRIANLMSACDFAIGAGGSMSFERFCVGLPSLVITIAENQVAATERLHQDGYLLYVGRSSVVTPEDILSCLDRLEPCSLADIARRGRALVDGRGVKRVLQALYAES